MQRANKVDKQLIPDKSRIYDFIIKMKRRDAYIGGYCLLLSAMFLLICTKSSPLYPFNDWVDANAFFTMGKGMMNGKILYQDLSSKKVR